MIRPERSFENFSRSLELIRAIRSMWDVHAKLPPGQNQTIEDNIQKILDDFDLTVDEWHYWARHCSARDTF